ncbi:GNAT family N-acetyltransferase [Rossellomorea aquimaris]|uniref:GNAT family N-acetyltransferase n=1 Tax=Rossellomorea aquimaris TaxID=189382 RepID=UPI001CD4FBA8|nr:GNAT family N-acetyltransferase [Rossellomorea aquimaris]MCA1058924.1 GNAT family N-acetyltransferase [Rossellomorea aquimaris]
MSSVRIEKAHIEDVSVLTAVQTKVFDAEKMKWFPDRTEIVDTNIQPPGYDSIEMNTYMLKELDYFKVVFEGGIVGGLILTVIGRRHGRVDRIFIDPAYQGKGIGSTVIKLMEREYAHVVSWELETSSLQLNNHRFYEKMGYQKIFESPDEHCYEKRMNEKNGPGGKTREVTILGDIMKDVDFSGHQLEHCIVERADFYGINGSYATFSNSSMTGVQFSNCNLEGSRFQNINFKRALIADLNLSYSEFAHVSIGGLHVHDTNLGDEGEPITFERCVLEGSMFENCSLKNVDISDCEISGMKIDGILVEDLLEAHAHRMKK